MRYLINLINSKTVSAVVAAVGVAACFVAEPAQAQLFRYSGAPNSGQTNLDFDLDTSVQDSSSAPNVGIFQEAVQNATYTFTDFSTKQVIKTLSFNPADIRASQITDTTYKGLNFLDSSFIGGVKYEAALEQNGTNDPSAVQGFAFFVRPPSDGSNINNLIKSLRGVGGNAVAYDFGSFTVSFPSGFTVTPVSKTVTVPEPNPIGSLSVFGTLGGLLLLQGNNRSRKLAQSNPNSI